jgi:hypothetical protein
MKTMRIPVLPTAVTASLLLGSLAAASTPAAGRMSPPAAPIFYCPRVMAAPAACPAPRHGAVVHRRRVHARRFERFAGAERHGKRGGPEAWPRRDWAHHEEFREHGLAPREWEGAEHAWMHHGMRGPGEAEWAERDHGRAPHEFEGAEHGRMGHEMRQNGGMEWADREGGRGERGEEHQRVDGHGHGHAGPVGEREHADRWQEQGRERRGQGDEAAESRNRHGAYGHRFEYERREQAGVGGYLSGERDGEAFGWSWGQAPGGEGFSEAPRYDGPRWRYGQGGGYEVYHAAGRDEDGYLVWPGKPRR